MWTRFPYLISRHAWTLQRSPSFTLRLFRATKQRTRCQTTHISTLAHSSGEVPTLVHLNLTLIDIFVRKADEDGIFALLSSNDDSVTSEETKGLHRSGVHRANRADHPTESSVRVGEMHERDEGTDLSSPAHQPTQRNRKENKKTV